MLTCWVTLIRNPREHGNSRYTSAFNVMMEVKIQGQLRGQEIQKFMLLQIYVTGENLIEPVGSAMSEAWNVGH